MLFLPHSLPVALTENPQRRPHLPILGPIPLPQSSTGWPSASLINNQNCVSCSPPLMAGNEPENLHSRPPSNSTPGTGTVWQAACVVTQSNKNEMKKTALFLTTFKPSLFQLWILQLRLLRGLSRNAFYGEICPCVTCIWNYLTSFQKPGLKNQGDRFVRNSKGPLKLSLCHSRSWSMTHIVRCSFLGNKISAPGTI